MCGIIGYVGKRDALSILLKGLEKLEYRGYDSAGIAVMDEKNEVQTVKSEGKLSALVQKTENISALSGVCGIGHTRWATHGAPTEKNAHPHSSERVTAVHNGIIENAGILKKELLREGYAFYSETDTEVAVKLMDYYYRKTKEPISALLCVMKRLRGSYAFAVMFKDRGEELFAMKKDSPLIVGIGDGENFLASDVPAVLHETRRVYYMNDMELARLSEDKIEFYDHNGAPLQKNETVISFSASSAEKNGFPHFMLKEIYEAPRAIRDTLRAYKKGEKFDLSVIGFSDMDIRRIRTVWFVACGSSYHVCVAARSLMEKLAKIPSRAEYASEFRYSEPLLQRDDLVIVISQSGETADTLGALREAKKRGAETVAIVNTRGSSIEREADRVLYTFAGPEIAVATTKAYSAQLIVCDILSLVFAKIRGTLSEREYERLFLSLYGLPDQMETLFSYEETLRSLALRFEDSRDTFFVGRGLDYAAAMEGSLKMKEISYVHAEAYAAGELKHGTISLIEKDTLAIGILTQKDVYEKTLSNMVEMKSRGAFLVGVTDRRGAEGLFDFTILLPETAEIFAPSLVAVPLQMLAYELSVARGLDPDKPRSLAKSVTVE